jgi:hypothetical protein
VRKPPLKKLQTPKLFYKQYPYKLVFYTKFANSFRGNDLAYIREMLDQYYNSIKQGHTKLYLRRWKDSVPVTTEDLAEVHAIYSALSIHTDYKIRVENNYITIYSVDKHWLYKLATNLEAQEWWEPLEYLEPGILIMGPKMKGWGYKITLGPRVPKSFYDWAINNTDKLKIGNKLQQYLKTRGFVDGYYFYVRNEKMLNLVSLVAGQGIQRVDKIVIDDQNA